VKESGAAPPPSSLRAALTRGVLFFLLLAALMQSRHLADLAFGVLVALGATLASLHLLPQRAGSVRMARLLSQVPRLMWESTRAGFDVARRVFDPRMPLATGFVEVPLKLEPGLPLNTFATITSLLPGTVPVGDSRDGLVYHCLDIEAPVVQELLEEERRLAAVLVPGQRDV
jgi:multicomponent Na+:H+ antiporter subunit E